MGQASSRPTPLQCFLSNFKVMDLASLPLTPEILPDGLAYFWCRVAV